MTQTSIKIDSYIERKAFDETKQGVKDLVDAKITEIPRIFHLPKDTLNNKKPLVSDLKIPTIDFTNIHVDTAAREAVVEKVKYAAENWGFFQVINHGIPLNVIQEIKDGVRRFHEEDPEVKKLYFSREYDKIKFKYNSNFDLYSSSSSVNWKDSWSCNMAPHPPNPEELPVTCRLEVIYRRHIMEAMDKGPA